jgi:transposase
VIDAIAWKFQTGSQGVRLPEKYGNRRSVYNRLRMWAVDGTWEREFTALMAQADADEDLNWAVSVDSTIVRAHQHATGARKKGPLPASRTTMPFFGRSRGGLTTKIHLAADAHCRPLAFVLTAGQSDDAPAISHVMARLHVPRRRGRPRTRLDVVLTDKAWAAGPPSCGNWCNPAASRPSPKWSGPSMTVMTCVSTCSSRPASRHPSTVWLPSSKATETVT